MSAATATHVEYITKEEAAARLDISPRRVQELGQKGELRRQKKRNPVTGTWQKWIHAGDVERLRDSRDGTTQEVAAPARSAPAAPAAAALRRISTEPNALALASDTEAKDAKPAEAAAPAALSAPAAPPLPDCAWLTLDEADRYTGLPSTYLLSAIREGKLPALDVGIRPGGRWRVKRGDLDAIVGVRVEPRGLIGVHYSTAISA